MHVTAILLAAGRGIRLQSKIPKPLVQINSRPVVIYSLEGLSTHPAVRDIILVVNSGNRAAIIKQIKNYRIAKIKGIVSGGRRRQDSVLNGLKAIDRSTDFVLIHDAARPFIEKKLISDLIREAGRSGAAIPGVPVKATIKSVKVSGYQSVRVVKTVDRSSLWEIQTPQVFKKDLLLQAYKKFGSRDVTDDAMLVEKLRARVKVVKGSDFNIKITTPEDLLIARALAKTGKF